MRHSYEPRGEGTRSESASGHANLARPEVEKRLNGESAAASGRLSAWAREADTTTGLPWLYGQPYSRFDPAERGGVGVHGALDRAGVTVHDALLAWAERTTTEAAVRDVEAGEAASTARSNIFARSGRRPLADARRDRASRTKAARRPYAYTRELPGRRSQVASLHLLGDVDRLPQEREGAP